MKEISKEVIFKEMDLGIRWLLTLLFVFIYNEFYSIQALSPPIHSQLVFGRQLLFNLSVALYGLKLCLELYDYAKQKFSGDSIFQTIPALAYFSNFSSLGDYAFFYVCVTLMPELFIFSIPLLMYFTLMFTLRTTTHTALRNGFGATLCWTLLSFQLSTDSYLQTLAGCIVIIGFAAIIQEIDKAFDVFYQRNLHAIHEIEVQNTLLEKRSNTDFLTDLYNHQAFYNALDKFTRKADPVALILFDVDNFKKINDTYGHLSGDYVLREIAHLIRSNLRQDDLAARYGGEEFAVLLPHSNLSSAYQIAERIRTQVSLHPFMIDNATIQVTLSGGVGMTQHRLDKNKQAEFVDSVDARLYQAKKTGKNKVIRVKNTLPFDEEHFIKELTHMDKALTALHQRVLATLHFELETERILPLEQSHLKSIILKLDGFAESPESLNALRSFELHNQNSLSFHNIRTAFYALAIAKRANLTDQDCMEVGLSAILHDLGKLSLPQSVLEKPGRLTAEEYEQVKTHSQLGFNLIQSETWLTPAVKSGILNHHERLDGSGYPQALGSEKLSFIERIVAVADVFDAITSQRSYKESQPAEFALQMLQNEELGRLDTTYIQLLSDWVYDGLNLLEAELSEFHIESNLEESSSVKKPILERSASCRLPWSSLA